LEVNRASLARKKLRRGAGSGHIFVFAQDRRLDDIFDLAN
jgi:hypothetical protein